MKNNCNSIHVYNARKIKYNVRSSNSRVLIWKITQLMMRWGHDHNVVELVGKHGLETHHCCWLVCFLGCPQVHESQYTWWNGGMLPVIFMYFTGCKPWTGAARKSTRTYVVMRIKKGSWIPIKVKLLCHGFSTCLYLNVRPKQLLIWISSVRSSPGHTKKC